MSHIASLVAPRNMFCIILYLFNPVSFSGNKSTTTTTTATATSITTTTTTTTTTPTTN